MRFRPPSGSRKGALEGPFFHQELPRPQFGREKNIFVLCVCFDPEIAREAGLHATDRADILHAKSYDLRRPRGPQKSHRGAPQMPKNDDFQRKKHY